MDLTGLLAIGMLALIVLAAIPLVVAILAPRERLR